MTFTAALKKLLDRQPLTRSETRDVMGQLMRGELTPAQIASFLTALRLKGETVDEITGAAEAMREAAIPVRCAAEVLVDTCGTGGDGQGSFNISTAAAFVVAGAGFTVAKHGNRSISSRCGSADVLEALGIPVEIDARTAERCLKDVGIAFLFAPAYHPAMKHAMPVRKELGVRTIFNLLGPLTNPAKPSVQLIGVYDPAWVEPVARVLTQLGCREGLVVHGAGHDEVVLSGPTQMAEVKAGHVHEGTLRPEDFGLVAQAIDVPGGSAPENAQLLLELLEGKKAGPARDIVCMNAAAVLQAAFRARKSAPQIMTLKEAYQFAQESMAGKKALDKFKQLKEALSSARPAHG